MGDLSQEVERVGRAGNVVYGKRRDCCVGAMEELGQSGYLRVGSDGERSKLEAGC